MARLAAGLPAARRWSRARPRAGWPARSRRCRRRSRRNHARPPCFPLHPGGVCPRLRRPHPSARTPPWPSTPCSARSPSAPNELAQPYRPRRHRHRPRQGPGRDRPPDRLPRGPGARGGTAMIVTELMNVHPTSSGAPILVSIHDEANLGGLSRWAEAVERHGCRLIGQLGHIGRQQLWGLDSVPRSASSQPETLYWNSARPLGEDEIPGIVAGYAESAERLKRAGFSGGRAARRPRLSDRAVPLGPPATTGGTATAAASKAAPASCARVMAGGPRCLRRRLHRRHQAAGGRARAGRHRPPTKRSALPARAAAEGVLDYLAFSQGRVRTCVRYPSA